MNGSTAPAKTLKTHLFQLTHHGARAHAGAFHRMKIVMKRIAKPS
jgi:hypothetical protein